MLQALACAGEPVTCYGGAGNTHILTDTVCPFAERKLMADRDHFRESAPELPTPLSVLYSVVDDAQKNSDYLRENAQGIYDQELADFLLELRDETNRRAKRAEALLAQRLADGGVQ
jgi:hypothetical protein